MQVDQQIREHILDEIKSDAQVQGEDADVAVRNGIATYLGTVREFRHLRRVVEIAEDTQGVERVRSVVDVAPSQGADDDLVSEVEKALSQALSVDVDLVTVEAAAGEVTLRGGVTTHFGKAQAREAARSVPGVSGIRDELLVTGPLSQ